MGAKMKTADLVGAALDWAVGYAQRLEATGCKPIQARDLMAAAMRCYVVSKLGEEVEIPYELV
jgi:hypothetical protein